MAEAVFTLEGERFLPSANAGSPWGDAVLHGAAPNGLLARAVEQFAGEPNMLVTRLTIDLFRPVPKAPLAVHAGSIRKGKRIHAVQASLFADGTEVCRANALLLRTSAALAPTGGPVASPAGPEGIETTSLARPDSRSVPRRAGFHTTLEARWVSLPGVRPYVAWVRIPVPLVAGEAWSPLARAAATADFVNALNSIGGPSAATFINTDTTLYLQRLPVGDWLCLEVSRSVEPAGVGVAHATLYDLRGPFGTAAQALLANTMS